MKHPNYFLPFHCKYNMLFENCLASFESTIFRGNLGKFSKVLGELKQNKQTKKYSS